MPNATRLLLLRHAQHDLAGRALAGRMPGLGINAAGRAQALALAKALASRSIAVIACSPQRRARETVAPLLAQTPLPVEEAPEFDEIDFGDWTGLSFDEVRQRDPQAWSAWVDRRSQAQPAGGEAFADAVARAMAGVERLRLTYPGRAVLVVSHGDVIKAVLASVLGMPLDNLERFDVACASISEIDAGEGWMKVLAVNRTLAD